MFVFSSTKILALELFCRFGCRFGVGTSSIVTRDVVYISVSSLGWCITV